VARFRAFLGIGVGLFLLLSAFAHSVLGGKAMRAEMATAHVPADLASSLSLGWYLGGMAMVVFGGIVLWTFWNGWKGRPVSVVPATLISLGYVIFAVAAFVASDFEAFFMIVFGLPGALLGVAVGGAPKPSS
jgi:hypothetical protein